MNNAENTLSNVYTNNSESIERETCGCGGNCSDNMKSQQDMNNSVEQKTCGCGSECDCNS